MILKTYSNNYFCLKTKTFEFDMDLDKKEFLKMLQYAVN